MGQEASGKGDKRPLRIGKYEVIAHIAKGGMGAVYKARDVDLNRIVALKILDMELAAKPNMVARFKREGRSAALLRHENIVAIYDFGESNGLHFLALEFVDGKDLQDYVNLKGKLDIEEARLIIVQALRALDHAHAHKVVHRDIKPSNFLITKKEDGHWLVKLTDLGLARKVNDEEFRVTKAETTVGTVDYMSPEQAQDSTAADIRSDIYSLGCTFYHLLAGKCPFPTGSLVERILKHREAEPPDVRALNPSVPWALQQILAKMMAKKPEDRYQTPRELLVKLEALDLSPFAMPPDVPGLVPLEPLPSKRTALPRAVTMQAPVAAEAPATKEYVLRDKTEEFQRYSKSAAAAKKRKPELARPRSKKGKALWQVWWPWVGGIAVALTTLVALSMRKTDPSPDKSAESQKKAPIANPVDIPPKKKPATTPSVIGPELPVLPLLYRPAQPWNVPALRQEFMGPFQDLAAMPADAKVVQVCRLPGSGQYRSLAEALAKTTGSLIVEIHDQGPLFQAPLPEVRGRSLLIKGGPGFRPVLAWDIAADKDNNRFLELFGGSLLLEGIDVVAKWPAGRDQKPAGLFTIHGGHFQASACTFSIAGSNSGGMSLVHIDNIGPDPGLLAKVHFQRCYARGPDLTLLDAKSATLEALVEESLLVGGDLPLIQTAGAEETIRIRLVRSTLVCNQNCLKWTTLANQPRSPRLQVLAWDSILARANPASAQGDMFWLDDNANLNKVSWQPVNCLYAGWKRLLVSVDKNISAGALDLWRALWSIREGDKELAETWPLQAPVEPELLAAQAYSPYDTPALYAASGGPGALGCPLGRLPTEPPLWLARTFEHYPMPIMSLPEAGAPPIPANTDGLYHGERLDVTKVDLGKHLQDRLQTAKPAARVVMHLTGAGRQRTSLINVKGVHLTLYFEPVRDKQEPLTLIFDPPFTTDRKAWLEVTEGNLEIINGRFMLDGKKAGPVPAHLLRVGGGDLILDRCFLQGCIDQAPPGFLGLARFDSPSKPGEPLPALIAKDSVLLSAGILFEVRGAARVRLRNCMAVAAEDALVFTSESQDQPQAYTQLEQTTFAVRKAMMSFDAEEARPKAAARIVVQAQKNYFLNPFPAEPRRACLVRVSGATLSQGALQWQGKDNAFDGWRMGGLKPNLELGKYLFQDWQEVWGSSGERGLKVLEPTKQARPFNLAAPSWAYLALPPQLRPASGPPPFGADLARLGIIKK